MPNNEELSKPHVVEDDAMDDPKGLDREIEVLQLAHDVETTRPSATTPAMLKLYLILSVGYFCIILQGYDGSLMGAINAMPQYLNYYGL